MNDSKKHVPSPALWQAILPVIVLIALLVINVLIYKDDATYGPNQIALLLAAAVAAAIGYTLKIPFKEMLEGINTSLGSAIGAMIILLLVGSLAGTWLISGIVPAMIYYGLEVLNPAIFLIAAVVVCAIVSVATGSSWSTVATVGVALLGIGQALGLSTGMIAGAVISGAYFGDKMSPLSDTTNLAPAMAGSELFTHIKYMMYTTVPSIIITLIIFGVIGLNTTGGDAAQNTDDLRASMAESFNMNPLLFLVPAAVVFMVMRKVNAIVALFIGTILGGVFAIIFQPEIIKEVAGAASSKLGYVEQCYVAVVNSMFGDVQIASKDKFASELMNSSGMNGMLNTIWLIVTAMCFGGIMEACGLLRRITEPLVKMANTDGTLVATTAGSCMFTNLTASDQYLSIVVPGRMFRETYKERGLAPEVLSRTLEDAGTVTSPLVPWNTCAAYHAGLLVGGNALVFIPYCFFNIISPLMTMLVAFLGIKIRRLAPKKDSST